MSICAEATVPERLPVDQSHRDRIVKVRDTNQFVEAGAGSGKTARSSIGWRRSCSTMPSPSNTSRDHLHRESRRRTSRPRPAAFRSDAHDSTVVDDPQRRDRAEALLQLDGAAIGTLHSFAQRLLGEHPVEAGLPPGVDVLDEISSQVEFEQRWQVFLDALLDDDTMAHTLLCLEACGVRLDDLRSLTVQMADNWDLVEERLDFDAPTPPTFDRSGLLTRIDDILELGQYAAHDDSLLARFPDLRDNRADLAGALDDIDALAIATDMGSARKAADDTSQQQGQ